MDIFTRFNRKSIDDRRIDTLIGVSKGLIADEAINQSEAEFLLSWLIQNQQSSDHPILVNLLSRVEAMLVDGVLDDEESRELLSILKSISGETSEVGELAKSSTLPIDSPCPDVLVEGKRFCFTGTFCYGSRKLCHEVVASRGGIVSKNVTLKLDYLVLGAYVSDGWVHESYGRKIETAMDYRSRGYPVSIISEEHWANELGL